MRQDWWLPALLVVLTVVTVVLGVALVRLRARAHADLAAARREADELRERVAGIEQRLGAEPAPAELADPAVEFLITDLPAEGSGAADLPPPTPGRIEGRLFADLVLRESVVKAAALAHGVRRAWAPENRHRIRYEIVRETRRSRKQRRVELKAARRQLHAQRRAAREDAA